jgi:N-acetylmuramoyl-L-alanine amidase
MPMPSSCNSALIALLTCLWLGTTQAAEPTIVSRTAWQAKAPSSVMTKQVPVAILIHHTGTPQKPKTALEAKLRGLQRFSQAREKLSDGRMKPAWPDVPYHFYISVDGRIGEGRDVNAVGDTNTSYDPQGFIQIVVEGNFETESPTPAELASLSALLQSLTSKYNIRTAAILPHNGKAQTACPGKNLEAELPGILKALK